MIAKIRLFFELVKFEHTIFAIPFAYLGMVLAAKGIPGFYFWFWVTLAMVGARTAAMAFNRLIDERIDAKNPRTANRPLPQKRIQRWQVILLAIISIGLLLISAGMLNPLCLWLSPIAIILLVTYSYTKRFTWLSHYALGLVEAAAPIGGWLAITGRFEFVPFLIGAAVIFWLAGFDIIYAIRDIEFDKKEGLYSIPVKFGLANGLVISAILHLFTIAFLIYTGIYLHLGLWYWIGILLTTGLLIYEHSIITPKDLSRLNQAFFTMNGWVSVVLFGCTLMSFIV
ncbi:MAG: UbiA-like polyprenyltransferase [bacterium]|nr:UbiA-like polyprenyltransferase [bacterium]